MNIFSLRLLACLQVCLVARAASIGEGIMKKIVKTCGKPEISNVMQNLTLRPGDTARFRCTVDMKCLVSYIQWHHEMSNGTVRLLKTARNHGNPYTFIIEDVRTMDSGLYTCVAGNTLGETISTAYLEVSSAPSVTRQITGLLSIGWLHLTLLFLNGIGGLSLLHL